MLRAEELRIGNIISLTGKPIRISFSTLEKLSFPELSKYQIYEGKFKPIELSEDILLMCGFEKGPVYYSLNDFDIYLDGWFGFNDMVATADIKYLHQLQNLYFALTGKELEVKL